MASRSCSTSTDPATRALVFVHGWSCDRSYWVNQMASFAPRHRVVAIDLAGHGESGSGRESWTMPAFGGDVAAVARQIGADDVILVGHSMGGDVIVDAALQLGGRVRGLVWIDVYSDLNLDEADGRDTEDPFVTSLRGDFRAEVDRFVRAMFPPDADPALVDRVAGGHGIRAAQRSRSTAARHSRRNLGPALAGLRAARDFRSFDQPGRLGHRRGVDAAGRSPAGLPRRGRPLPDAGGPRAVLGSPRRGDRELRLTPSGTADGPSEPQAARRTRGLSLAAPRARPEAGVPCHARLARLAKPGATAPGPGSLRRARRPDE